MNAISYSYARANLAITMEEVCQNHEEVIITRQGSPSAVLISLEDYNALKETFYLLRSPQNARKLLESMEKLESGDVRERVLLEK